MKRVAFNDHRNLYNERKWKKREKSAQKRALQLFQFDRQYLYAGLFDNADELKIPSRGDFCNASVPSDNTFMVQRSSVLVDRIRFGSFKYFLQSPYVSK